MSGLLRGTIAVIVLVIVISVGYLVIQNYEDRKFAEEDSKQKQDHMNAQEQQDTKTILEAEKDKVDTLVHAMQNHTTIEGNITEKTESPF